MVNITCEQNSQSLSKEIPHLLWNLTANCQVRKSLLMGQIQATPLETVPFLILFNHQVGSCHNTSDLSFEDAGGTYYAGL